MKINAFIIVIVITIFDKMLGLFKDVLVANNLGAGVLSDVYYMAVSIPLVLYSVIGTTLNSILLPIISRKYEKEGKDQAFTVTSELLFIVILILGLFTSIGILWAPYFVKIFAVGFEKARFEMTVSYVRILFPTVIFVGMTAVLSALCQIFNKFSITAVLDVVLNIIIILAFLLFAGSYDLSYLMYATLFGYIMRIIVMVPSLHRIGFKFSFRWRFDPELVRQVTSLSWPVIIGSLALQLYSSVDRAFTSLLSVGSITHLNYATKIRNLPINIFVMGIGTIVFPYFSKLAAKDNREQFRNLVVKNINYMFLIGIPLSVIFSIFSVPFVELLFARGKFSMESVNITAQVLVAFSIGLVPAVGMSMISRIFYAMHDMKIPSFIAVSTLILNVVLDYVFMQFMGVSGIALATTVASFINLSLYMVLLNKRLGTLFNRLTLMPIVYWVMINVLAGLLGYFTLQLIPWSPHWILQFTRLFLASGTVCLLAFGLGYLCKSSLVFEAYDDFANYYKWIPKRKSSNKNKEGVNSVTHE